MANSDGQTLAGTVQAWLGLEQADLTWDPDVLTASDIPSGMNFPQGAAVVVVIGSDWFEPTAG